MVIKNGACPMPPVEPRPNMVPLTPIISVKSVNGETGDVVLKDLIIGDKSYNGSDEVEIVAADLGLNKAVVYIKTISTTAKVLEKLADAKVGDLFFCTQDGYFYLSVGEGDYKCFVSDLKLKAYSKIVDTASRIALEVDADTFKMVAKLYDINGNVVYTSSPVLLPSGMQDAIKYGYFDTETQEIVFVLKNDVEIRVPIAGLIENIQPKITETNKLPFRLVEGLPELKVAVEQAIAAEIEDRTIAIASEAVTRGNADTAEREERVAADEELRQSIYAETAAREEDFNKVSFKLDTEINQRKEAFDLLKVQIKEEAEERVELEGNLEQEIANRVIGDEALQSSLSNEIIEREAGDNTLTDLISAERNNRITNVRELRNSLTNETNARTIRDAELADLIDDEKVARESNDELIIASVTKEASDRTDADNREKGARIAADDALGVRIDTEISDRELAVADLQNKLNAEEAERIRADGYLQTSIQDEIDARTAADITLQSNIDIETGAREAADEVLQEQINDIPVYSIVRDANPGQYSAIYHLTKKVRDGEAVNIGDPIQIAKDFLVKSAFVKTVVYPENPYPGAKPGDKYIDFIINTKESVDPSKEEHLYLPVNDLVDIYKAGRGITISDDNIVSINDDTLNRIATVETGLNTERLSRIDGDSQLATSIDNLGKVLTLHTEKRDNPHQVTKEQVGLGNVDNTSDIDKPVSIAQQAALNAKTEELTALITSTKTTIEEAIAAEAKLRNDADDLLTLNINNEISVRTAADSNLFNQINTEVTNRESAVTNEANTRFEEDTKLWDAINAINSKITSVAKDLVCDGVNKEFTINHNLDTYNVMVQVYEKDAPCNMVVIDNARVSANTIKLIFKDIPGENKSYVVMCYGIPMTYTLTFNANGGTGTMDSVNVVKGMPHIMEQCTFTPPHNMQFDKWAINSIEGTKVKAGEPYTFNMNTEAFAIWKSSEPNFYWGAVDSIPPTSTAGMVAEFVPKEDLLIRGYEKVLPIVEGQFAYEAIAFVNEMNLEVIKVEDFVFGQWNDVTEDFRTINIGAFTICYHINGIEGPTEENYRFTFKSKE